MSKKATIRKKVQKKKQTTAIANFDDELAKLAQQDASKEVTSGGGQWFSIRGGQLRLDGNPLPNNEMVGVILGSVMENVYYEGDFDPDNPSSPSCYAFGYDEDTIQPHSAAEEPQAESCLECPNNEWGSAAKGRGKACKNRRRLAIIPAGSLDRGGDFTPYGDLEHFAKAQPSFLAVPPTSVNGFAAYIKTIAASPTKRPAFAVFTRISLIPDDKTQVKLVFELEETVPKELVQLLWDRHKTISEIIEFPYQKIQAPKAKRPTAAPSAKKARRRVK